MQPVDGQSLLIALMNIEKTPSGVNMSCHSIALSITLEKLDHFYNMEIFDKYCRKSLENSIFIVLFNSMVWKWFPWFDNILKINFHTVEEVELFH